MPEMVKNIVEGTLSAVARLWKRLTGSFDYEVQASRVRIPDSRGAVYLRGRIRRSTPSGLDCDRY